MCSSDLAGSRSQAVAHQVDGGVGDVLDIVRARFVLPVEQPLLGAEQGNGGGHRLRAVVDTAVGYALPDEFAQLLEHPDIALLNIAAVFILQRGYFQWHRGVGALASAHGVVEGKMVANIGDDFIQAAAF